MPSSRNSGEGGRNLALLNTRNIIRNKRRATGVPGVNKGGPRKKSSVIISRISNIISILVLVPPEACEEKQYYSFMTLGMFYYPFD